MGLIDVAIDRLLETDPAAWLGVKLTEPQDPMPETVGEAMDMVKLKARTAIDAATKPLHSQIEQSADHVQEILEEKAKLRRLLDKAWNVVSEMELQIDASQWPDNFGYSKKDVHRIHTEIKTYIEEAQNEN